MCRPPPLRSLLLLAPLAALACATATVHEKPWIEVRTQHFEIASCMSEAATLELARDLELFRSVVDRLTTAGDLDAGVPTRIYAFDSLGSYRDFGPPNLAGYFFPTMRGNVVVLREAWRMDPTQVIQHEYVHFVLRNRTAHNYPIWFDEGLAELLSTVNLNGEFVTLGQMPKHHAPVIRFLRWLPLHHVMEAQSYANFHGDDIHMFYAQSWALTHYLHYGRENEERFSMQFQHYLALLDEGASQEDAVQKAFGVPIRTLGRELIAYVENGRFRAFRIPKHNFATESQPSLRPLRRDEIANELGWIALSGNPARAQRYFEAAIAANPEYARAHAGLGDAYKFQKRWDEARPHYERALALAPDDALNQLEYAEYLHERAKAEKDPEERARLVRQARHHYVRSQKLDPDLPETYAMYGASFLVEGEDPERGLDTLEHARAMLRSNLDIQLMLAQLYVKTGRRAEARDLLETVTTWAHGGDLADEANALLAELNGPRGENPTDRRD